MDSEEIVAVEISREDDGGENDSTERKNQVSDEDDHEKFLSKIKQRFHRVGLHLPTVEVRFEDLKVDAEVYMGERALPTLYNYTLNSLHSLLRSIRIVPNPRKRLPILRNVSGVVKPGRLTLLLGPPSSGKSTLLQALSGKLDPHLKVCGKVTYNGSEMNEFVPQRTSSYISQYDVHIPDMTVRETLTFSAKCQGVGSRYEMMGELLRRERELGIIPESDIDAYMKASATTGQENVVIDYIIKILGLEVCADTLVGNYMVRGISGGQKKRLTIGEMMVGPTRVFFMDEISNGLDSATTFHIMNAIKHSSHILEETTMISLLQPSSEVYDLFDDIILLAKGTIVYHGLRENVLPFFQHMGFKCPATIQVPDFLQQITSPKDQEKYWNDKEKPYGFVSVDEFSQSFRRFDDGLRLADELATPLDKKNGHPLALTTKMYGEVTTKQLLAACFSREKLLLKRQSSVYRFKQIQFIILGIILMTAFPRGETHSKRTITDGRLYMGALYYALIMATYNNMPEISQTTTKLPVFYKQRDSLFFPSWAYSFSQWILKIPITAAFIFIWVSLTYYVIGYDPELKRFLKQVFLLILFSQMAGGLFRLTAALGRNGVVANTIGSAACLTFIISGGFVLSRDNMVRWWRWTYWISPFMYGQTGLAVNEFLGKSWSHVPRNSTESLGIQELKFQNIFEEGYWYWIGIAALIGFLFIFNFTMMLALAYLNPYRKEAAILLSDESVLTEDGVRDEGDDLNMKGEIVLPFASHCITFEDITYAVDMPEEMKKTCSVQEGERLEILKGVSGVFRPGVLTALMGVTGAGKTTLLDVLSGRKTQGYTTGTIKVSGCPIRYETFARISGYCEQTDVHSPYVTVHESLLFSSWLRLSPGVTTERRNIFIKYIMELMELTQLKNALVGVPSVSGLSMEQRKRLTIAVELVKNPSILFLDEPTSGLDARAAAIVMRILKKLVDAGRTVVCTIHQPSIDIFNAFDELLLLKEGGEEIYFGPLGSHSSEMINYFEGIGGVSKLKHGCNPSAWILEVTSPTKEAEIGVSFVEIYRNSHLYNSKNKALLKELSQLGQNSNDLHFKTRRSQPFSVQCAACLWRQTLSLYRNPSYSAFRLLFIILIALILGDLYSGVGSKRSKEEDILDAVGSMFTAITFLGVQNVTTVQPLASFEMSFFYREKAAGLYSPFAYAFGQIVGELPYILLQTLIYSVIVYAMMGFEWKTEKFFWFFFFMLFALLYSTILGMLTVIVTPNEQVAGLTSSVVLTIWVLFSGFIIPKTRISVYWRWCYYATPYGWSLNGLAASQFGDVRTELDNQQTVEEFMRSYFGYSHGSVGYVAAVNAAIALLFGACYGFAINIFNFQKR